jgi:hypothetical protein
VRAAIAEHDSPEPQAARLSHLCGLSIEDKIPDHSAFSRIRHERFRESDMFRQVFERVVEACIAAGLVGGQGFAVDASLIVADANKQRSIAGADWKKPCVAETATAPRGSIWQPSMMLHSARRAM